MVVELIAERGDPRQHSRSLRALLESTKGPVRVASAYTTDDELLFGIKNRGVQLLTSLERMDVISGATSLPCLRTLIKSGVECRCLSGGPRFHAKVYIFGDEAAVVTSANLTTNALTSNIEVGVHINGDCVQELIAWFKAFWENAATPLTLPDVSKWEKETAALRRAYAALRRKARLRPPLPKEVWSSTPPAGFRELLNADRFFVCNTNRKHSPDGDDERMMRRSHYAAVWTDFREKTHMKRVEPGDAILMFAKGIGIVGIGRASGRLEMLLPGDPRRITTRDRYDRDEEWRIPIEKNWLFWAADAEDAYRWTMPNGSFFDLCGETYRAMRDGVRKRFLGDK